MTIFLIELKKINKMFLYLVLELIAKIIIQESCWSWNISVLDMQNEPDYAHHM